MPYKKLSIVKQETLKDAADAIREKAGTSDPIAPEDFDDAIDSIPSGGGEISYTWNGNMNVSETPVVGTEISISRTRHGVSVGDHIELTVRKTGSGTLNSDFYLVRGEVTAVTSTNVFKLMPSYVQEDVAYLSSNTMNITENGTYEVYQYKGVTVNTPSALMLGWTGDYWETAGEWSELPSKELPTPMGQLALLSVSEELSPAPSEGDAVIARGSTGGGDVVVAGTVNDYSDGRLSIRVAAMSSV